MTPFIFANNIKTALASAVSSTATTITLASSTDLPSSIPTGYYLPITLNDAATGQIYEIVYATAVSGANLTVVRAQEGTSAGTWAIGDFVFSGPTAGQMTSPTAEIISVLTAAGLTPDRTNTEQLLAGLEILFPPYSGVKQVAPAIANATVINTSGATTTATVTFTAPANGWVIGFATTHLAAAGNSTGYQFSLLINGTTINQDTNPNTNTEYGFLSVTAGESCTVTGQVYLSGGVLSANANIQTFAFFIPNP